MKAVFNQHNESNSDFTIEFDVKNPTFNGRISEDILLFESETGAFTNKYGKQCFDLIQETFTSKKWSITDWGFAGRSNGWYVLECKGNESHVTEKQLTKIENIVKTFYDDYEYEMDKFY